MFIAPIDLTLTIAAPLALAPIAFAQYHSESFSALSNFFVEAAKKAQEDKQSYTDKLEGAEGDDIFKYILLINVSALEGYVAQTRIQAEHSRRGRRSVGRRAT